MVENFTGFGSPLAGLLIIVPSCFKSYGLQKNTNKAKSGYKYMSKTLKFQLLVKSYIVISSVLNKRTTAVDWQSPLYQFSTEKENKKKKKKKHIRKLLNSFTTFSQFNLIVLSHCQNPTLDSQKIFFLQGFIFDRYHLSTWPGFCGPDRTRKCVSLCLVPRPQYFASVNRY